MSGPRETHQRRLAKDMKLSLFAHMKAVIQRCERASGKVPWSYPGTGEAWLDCMAVLDRIRKERPKNEL